MEFNDINAININQIKTQKKDKSEPQKAADTQSAEKKSKKNAPNNPGYWQSTIGIKKSSPSFKRLNYNPGLLVPQEPVDEKFMKRCEKEIRKICSDKFNNNGLDDCLAQLQKISQYGKNTVTNYIFILSKCQYGNEDRYQEMTNALFDKFPNYNPKDNETFINFFQRLPYKTGEEYLQIKDSFNKLLDKDLSQETNVLALLNYAKLISKSSCQYDSNFSFNQLTDLLIDKKPDFTDTYIASISECFNILSTLTTNRFEFFKNHFEKVLSDTESVSNEQLDWLFLYLPDKFFSIFSKDDYNPNDDYDNNFKSFSAFISNANSMDDKKVLLTPNFNSRQMYLLSKLMDSDEIKSEKFINFLKNVNNSIWEPQKETVRNIVDTILNDKSKLDIFNFIINRDNLKSITGADIQSILNNDTEVVQKAIEYISSKEDNGDEVFDMPRSFARILELLDKDNIQDFINLTQDKSSTQLLLFAKNYKNPKTNKFDMSLYKYAQYIENQLQEDDFRAISIAKASVDMSTGKISSMANELLRYVYLDGSKFKKKMIGVAGKFLKRPKNRLNARGKFNGRIETIIETLKTKDGKFNYNNFNYVMKILKDSNDEYNGYYYLPDFIYRLKDDDGIINEKKYNNGIQILKKTKNYDAAANVIDNLNEYPREKQQYIFDALMGLTKNQAAIFYDFIHVIDFCIDKNGNIKKDNYDFLHSILSSFDDKKHPIELSGEFLTMCDYSEENKDFVRFLISKPNKKQSINLSELGFIFKEFKTDDNKFPSDIKKKIEQCVDKDVNINDFRDIYKACIVKNEETEQEQFNPEMFAKALEYISIINRSMPFELYIPAQTKVAIANNRLNLDELEFKEKVKALRLIEMTSSYISENKLEGFEHLNEIATNIDTALNSGYNAMPVDKLDRNNFISNVLKINNKDVELTPFENVIKSSIPMLENMTDGLPIKYSRQNFLNDLSKICNENPNAIEIITSKTGIEPIYQTDEYGNIEINGYNGLITLSKLDKQNKTEKSIYDCMYKFMYNNSIETDKEELNNQLNYIIKAFPEFINTIGKKQHGTHKYTLDIHQLLVLAYSINNPNYKTKLNAQDKTILKLSAIFHDIMKKENEVDKGHQNVSSIYARNIVKKVMQNPNQIDRLYDIINNHHWLEQFENAPNKTSKTEELAFRFRRPNDFDIAQIMAESDLKAVSEDFYEHYKSALQDIDIKNIEKKLNDLYSTGNALFTDYFILPSKLDNHTESINGKTYKVINLHNIPENANMSEYGFINKKKKDLQFLVHMVDDHSIYNSLNTVKMLTSPVNGGVLSESVIRPNHTRTYHNRKNGVLLSQINMNIVNENSLNQGSGCEKDFNRMLELIFSNNSNNSRNTFRNALLQNLSIDRNSITDNEFAEFFKNSLASKTSLKEINPDKTYNIGQYSFSGQKLIQAITDYQNSLMRDDVDQHNEIIGYIPKIQAVISKSKSLNDVPKELLKFANENNLPVVLI